MEVMNYIQMNGTALDAPEPTWAREITSVQLWSDLKCVWLLSAKFNDESRGQMCHWLIFIAFWTSAVQWTETDIVDTPTYLSVAGQYSFAEPFKVECSR